MHDFGVLSPGTSTPIGREHGMARSLAGCWRAVMCRRARRDGEKVDRSRFRGGGLRRVCHDCCERIEPASGGRWLGAHRRCARRRWGCGCSEEVRDCRCRRRGGGRSRSENHRCRCRGCGRRMGRGGDRCKDVTECVVLWRESSCRRAGWRGGGCRRSCRGTGGCRSWREDVVENASTACRRRRRRGLQWRSEVRHGNFCRRTCSVERRTT
jgi:hypothetical protein